MNTRGSLTGFAVLFLRLLQVHHQQALRHADLDRGKADARRVVHRLEHVGDQRAQLVVHRLDRRRRSGGASDRAFRRWAGGPCGRFSLSRSSGVQATGSPAPRKRLGKRAFVEIVELAADRKAVGQLGEANREISRAARQGNGRWSGPRGSRSSPARPRRYRRPRRARPACRSPDPRAERLRAPTGARRARDSGRGTAGSGRAPTGRRLPRPRTASVVAARIAADAARIAGVDVAAGRAGRQRLGHRLQRRAAAAPAPPRASSSGAAPPAAPSAGRAREAGPAPGSALRSGGDAMLAMHRGAWRRARKPAAIGVGHADHLHGQPGLRRADARRAGRGGP